LVQNTGHGSGGQLLSAKGVIYMTVLLVAGCGVLGVLSRYGLNMLIPVSASGFSVSVITVNALGSFLGGVFIGSPFMSMKMTPAIYAAVAVGFLGGFTTFSAVSMDTVRLWNAGSMSGAVTNLLLNNLVSISACFVGFKMGARFA
jgi:fluoride exporter